MPETGEQIATRVRDETRGAQCHRRGASPGQDVARPRRRDGERIVRDAKLADRGSPRHLSQSIETLSHWCVFHRKRAKTLAPVWQRELRAAPGKRKLSFLYLANDVLQNSRKKERVDRGAVADHGMGDETHTEEHVATRRRQKSRARNSSRCGWTGESSEAGRSRGGSTRAPRADVPTPPTPPPRRTRRRRRRARAGRAPQGGAFDRDPRGADRQERGSGEVLEAAEKAIAALAAADATCAADLRDEVPADGFVRRRRTPRTPSARSRRPSPALAARREALEEAAAPHGGRAPRARSARGSHEAAAESASEAEKRAPASPSRWRRSA